MKKKSISFKIFVYFLLFTIIMIGVLWLVQAKFLPEYYYNEKVKILEGYAKETEEIITEHKLTNDSYTEIQEIIESVNGRLVIYDRSGQVIINEGTMSGQMRGIRIPPDKWNNILSGETVSYHTMNARGNQEFLVVIVPGSEYIYLIQTYFQTIEEAISITRGFYFYLLGIGFITALLLAALFSRRLINPLIKLNNVAREMADLNFNVSWEDDREDEIGQLGKSLNYLTESLKKTIDELERELKKEKDIDKMRKEFVSRVSHELQTPIALISGYLEAIEDNIASDEKERQEYFRIIESEIQKISRLVREMLDLGQLESGTFKINTESFDYRHLINKILYKFEIIKKNKELEFEIQGKSSYMVIGDEYRIEQVLTNLLQNAVNHAYFGSKINITIEENEKKLITRVCNEGEKILEKDLPFVWESFYRGEKGKTGTGLGLAIAKNVLELHNSKYGVYNTENGVCFYFDL